jgi:hypothetical protein
VRTFEYIRDLVTDRMNELINKGRNHNLTPSVRTFEYIRDLVTDRMNELMNECRNHNLTHSTILGLHDRKN